MIAVQKNIPLCSYTTFGIGGPADFFVRVSTIDQLCEAITFANEKKLKTFIMGAGANILVGDRGFRGLVIKNEADKILDLNRKGDFVYLTVESGATVGDLISFTKEKGLSGFEHFAGIPSTVGGALWQNLHFLSPDRQRTVFIGDTVKAAEILRLTDMKRKKVENSYFNFSYDYSILHDLPEIVLTATFKLTLKPKEEIEKTIAANIAWRDQKHPEKSVKTSAGSVFKKIEGHGAGRLIEKVGLKGYSIGGAMISPKHANFIVNTGNAKAREVRELINLIQKKVKNELKLNLETEISFVGEF